MTARFPAPSLAAQIAELKRERESRRVYPKMIGSRSLEQHDAAIATLERLAKEST